MKRRASSLLAVVAALSMTVTSVLPAMAAPSAGDNSKTADPLENQVLDLEFEDNLNDSTNTIQNISFQGDGYEYVDGTDSGKALSLKGNTSLNLGTDVRLQPENLTLSFWIKPNAAITGEQIISWNKAEYNTDGWYLTSESDTAPLALSVGAATGQPYKVSVNTDRAEFFPEGEWTHIVVTYSSQTKEVKFYRNGVSQEATITEAITETATGVIKSDSNMQKSIGYNGPAYGWSYLNAALDHYELWNDTATEEQALALYEEYSGNDDSLDLTNQVLDLEFEDNLTDGTGKNTNIQISGSGYSYVDGQNSEKALSLTGNTYVDLGTNTELQPKNLTLSFWIKPNAPITGEQIITWNKNEWWTDGWYLSSNNDNTPLELSVGPAAEGGQPYKVSVKGDRAEFFPVNEWTHVVVTYNSDTKEIEFYRNGIVQATTVDYIITGESTGVLGSDETMQKSIGYNGPVHNGAYLNAALDHYELWNDVATYEDAVALYEAQGGVIDKKSVAEADLNALTIPEETSRNLALPSAGESGSVITWEVTAGTAMDENGVVARPEIGQPDAEVTLRATASFLGGETVTKDFTVTVLAEKPMDLSHTSIMDQVTLTDDYLVNAFEKEKEYLLSLSSEKFLYEFYKVAGLPPTTDSGYGGWERTGDANFRGHTFGHYMSALSQAYLSEDNADTKAAFMEEIKAAVNGLEKCQDAYAAEHSESAGYISAFPEGVLSRFDGGTAPTPDDSTVLVPYYNLHKVLAGLIDIAKNVDDEEIKNKAIDVAESFGEYLYNRCTNLPNPERVLWIEYGGMNEALYELYRITGNDHIKEAAECFDEVTLFQQLANNQDVLSGKHANTTIPKFTGAIKRYSVLTENEEYYDKLTQEEKDNLDMYLTAAKNFWDIVVNDHTYITGGNSQSEHFHNAGELCYDATKDSYNGALTCETCNTYNMLKLTKALYEQTGDSKYLDYFERTFTNAILASQNPETGTTMYFQPMAAGYNKVYNRPFDEFWCCTGTGMENFSKLGDYIYQIEGNTLYVNMFYGSEITDEALGLDLVQEANIPNDDTVTFTVNSIGEGTSIGLRKPEWLAGDAVITVNGKTQDVTEENGFFVLSGLEAGDVISYTMPMQIEFEATADNENFVAFKYGPVVLAAELGTKDVDASQGNGILVRVGTEDSSAKDTITIQNMSIDEWKANITENMVRIEDSEDGKIQFQLKNTDSEELIFSPYYEQHEQRYGIYMYLEEPDSQASQDRILAEKEQIREQEVSVDYLDSFDNNNSEFAKNLQTNEMHDEPGETSVGSFNGRTYRHADKGGWWSYDLEIDPDAEHNYLGCTWYSGDQGRSFEIYVNDKLLQPVTINSEAGTNVFYEDLFDITEYIEEGESTVTVRFQSTGGFAGGLFGIRVITSTEYDTDARLSALTFDQGTLSPAFDPDTAEYTLTVGTDVDSVNMLASTMKESGLVYIGDILFDNDNVRTIRLDGDTTVVELTSKAQDHTTAKKYTITIVKSDDVDQPEDYEVLEGGNGQWINDSKNGYSFKISGSADKFVGVKVDGTTLDASDYTLDKDNMVVTLSAEFLSALETKEHTVTFVYADGQVSTKLTIKAAGGGQEPGGEGGQEPGDGDGQQTGDNDQKNDGKDQNSDGGKGSNAPQTGDTTNIFGPAAACVLALGMAGTILYIRRKRS